MSAPAGWYPADRPGQERFWDGTAWTDSYRTIAGAAPTQPIETPVPQQNPSSTMGWGPSVGAHSATPSTNGLGRIGSSGKKWKIGAGIGAGLLVIGGVGAALGGGKSAPNTAATVTASTQPTAPEQTTSETPTTEATTPSPPPTSSQSPQTTTTTSAPPEPSAATIDGDGTFEVGTDIKPGLYVSPTPDSGNCYHSRLKDDQDTIDSIIDNGNSAGQSIVEIKATDKLFETNGCNEWVARTPANKPTAPTDSIPGDGIYQVGVDIKPGKYASAAPASGNCYYARLANLSGSIDSIITNGNSSGRSLITVRATDKFVEVNGCEAWTAR